MQNPIPLWRLAGNHYHIIRLAGVSGCAAVILGAYGAHRKFRPFDEPEERADLRAIFDTANKYHLLHSVALLAVPMTRNPVIVRYSKTVICITYIIFFSIDCDILHRWYHAFLW